MLSVLIRLLKNPRKTLSDKPKDPSQDLDFKARKLIKIVQTAIFLVQKLAVVLLRCFYELRLFSFLTFFVLFEFLALRISASFCCRPEIYYTTVLYKFG